MEQESGSVRDICSSDSAFMPHRALQAVASALSRPGSSLFGAPSLADRLKLATVDDDGAAIQEAHRPAQGHKPRTDFAQRPIHNRAPRTELCCRPRHSSAISAATFIYGHPELALRDFDNSQQDPIPQSGASREDANSTRVMATIQRSRKFSIAPRTIPVISRAHRRPLVFRDGILAALDPRSCLGPRIATRTWPRPRARVWIRI